MVVRSIVGGAAKRPGRVLAGMAALIVLLAIAFWFYDRAKTVYSSDARVAAGMIGISAEIRGKVAVTPAEVGMRVTKGTVLMRLDDQEDRFYLAELEAKLAAQEGEAEALRVRRTRAEALTTSRRAQRKAELRAAQAEVKSAAAVLRKSNRHYIRARDLQKEGVLSEEAWDTAQSDLIEAAETYEQAQAAIARLQARIREVDAEGMDAAVIGHELDALLRRQEETRRQIDRQQTVIDQHTLRAPVDGVIDELFLEDGEQALPGFRAILMHDPNDVYISANIKETNIRRVRIGAPVRITVDAFPNRRLVGRVVRIRDVATSEFALLPNPNASGVFTKITQRVPIRIEIDDTDLTLRPGTMVNIAIDASGNDANP